MDQTDESILRTLCLFAAQDRAATLLDVRRYFIRTDSGQRLPEIIDLYNRLESGLGGAVVGSGGLYALRVAEASITQRTGRYAKALGLMRRAKRFASGLRHLPFVRAAAISGSSAQLNARENSDIDLFIIVEPGRMFLARLFVSGYFQILGLRRHGARVAGRFCLNHYVAGAAYLPGDHTIYTALLYSSLLPVFGARQVAEFWRANQDWINDLFVQPDLPQSEAFPHTWASGSLLQRLLELLLLPLASFIEFFAKKIQTDRIRQSEYVIISQSELAFHPDSKGQRILAKYRDFLQATGLSAGHPGS